MGKANTVITSDESEIRGMFGFTKTIDKHPLVYKRQNAANGTISSHLVSSLRLVQLDSDKKMGTLEIDIDTGETIRICSAYLKEMQNKRFTFDVKVEAEG